MNEIWKKTYQLTVMLGEIKNEMKRGGQSATLGEIEELHSLACDIFEMCEKL